MFLQVPTSGPLGEWAEKVYAMMVNKRNPTRPKEINVAREPDLLSLVLGREVLICRVQELVSFGDGFCNGNMSSSND